MVSFRRRASPSPVTGWPALRVRCLPVSLARQRRLIELGVDGAWEVDLPAGMLTIGTLRTRIELLGNAGDGPASFLFGDAVARVNGLPAERGAAAARARRAAGPDGAGVLDRDEVPYSEVDPAELASVTSVLAGPAPMYRGPHGSGAIYFSLLDVVTDEPLPGPAVLSVAREVLLLGLADVRGGLEVLLAHEGFTVDQGRLLTARRGRSTVEAAFDDQGRCTDLSADLG